MSIDALQAIAEVAPVAQLAPAAMPAWTAATAASPGGTGFGALVAQGIASVDQDLAASAAALQSLASGQAGSLHRTMAKLEETRLSFQLFMQVRNRVLEAYQEVMKMQV